MKLISLIFQFTFFLIAASLVANNANAQESTQVKPGAKRPSEDYSLAHATVQHPLKPPETTSPRATLASFIDNINRSFSVLMAAHKKNLKSPSFFTHDEVEEMADNATGLFERAIWCLNLSEVPASRRQDVPTRRRSS